MVHIHRILNLVLAGNSNLVESTKESLTFKENLPLQYTYMGEPEGLRILKNPQIPPMIEILENFVSLCKRPQFTKAIFE